MRKPKILYYDIETSLMLVYTWQIGSKVSIGHNAIKEDNKIICARWKWEGQNRIHGAKWDKNQDDSVILERLAGALDSCDFAVAHNGDKFDWPWLKARLLDHGMSSPHIQTIDSYKLAASNFKFPSYRLDYLAKRFEVGKKLEHEGMDLWIKVMNGDKSALNHMYKYCGVDVEILEKVFQKMEPYLKTSPLNRSLIMNDVREGCPACGSLDYAKNGTRMSKVGRYQRFMCNKCAKSWHDTRMIKQ